MPNSENGIIHYHTERGLLITRSAKMFGSFCQRKNLEQWSQFSYTKESENDGRKSETFAGLIRVSKYLIESCITWSDAMIIVDVCKHSAIQEVVT